MNGVFPDGNFLFFSMYKTIKSPTMIGSDWSPIKREQDGSENAGTFMNCSNMSLMWNLM